MSLFGKDELSAIRESHARELRSKDQEIARMWALVGDLREQLRPPKPVQIVVKPRAQEEKTQEPAEAYEDSEYPAL